MSFYRMIPQFPTFHIVFHLLFLTATSNRVETFTMSLSSFVRWIIIVVSYCVVRRQSSVFRRSSVKVFACGSTSTVATDVRCQAAVGCQRELLFSSPPSGCDVRRLLYPVYCIRWSFRRIVSSRGTGLSSLDFVAHRCVAICSLHHSKL